MDKENFNKLPIDDQLKYYNQELSKGGSIVSVSNKIGVSESTMRSRFKAKGYRFQKSTNQFVKADNLENDDSKTNVIRKGNDNSSTNVIKTINDKCQTLVINKKLKENIIELAENHSELMEMLKWFNSDDRSHTNVIDVIEQGIKIDLPEETATDFRTTVRVNDIVWKEFQTFCKEYGQYTQKDLLSQALVEFITKCKR